MALPIKENAETARIVSEALFAQSIRLFTKKRKTWEGRSQPVDPNNDRASAEADRDLKRLKVSFARRNFKFWTCSFCAQKYSNEQEHDAECMGANEMVAVETLCLLALEPAQ